MAGTATVVGCTLARLVCDAILRERCFDVVILDEASMASIPFAHAAARRARQTVVYAGDFRQLPPIVLADAPEAKSWLGRDVFDHASLPTQEQRGGISDPRVTLLRTQYRMHSDISEIVSKVFYAGRLSGQVDDNVAHIASRAPFPGQVISVVDLRKIGPYCEAEPQARGSSRFNVLSAITSVTLAHQAAEAGCSVGIITPYRAQSSLVRAMLQDLGLDDVLVSTVHRFQGAEVDAVILDLTAARGKDSLGALLSGDVWSTAGRLLNVAVSRARGKLTILVDGQFLDDQWIKAAAGGKPSQALKRLLGAVPSARSVEHPTLAQWFVGLPAPRGIPPVNLHDAPMHDPRMGNRIGAAKRQLLLYVRPTKAGKTTQPGRWVVRSKDRPVNDPQPAATVIGRGEISGSTWQRLCDHTWRAGPRAQYPYNVFVADGETAGVDLYREAGCLILQMPATARVLAQQYALVPPGHQMERPPGVTGATPQRSLTRDGDIMPPTQNSGGGVSVSGAHASGAPASGLSADGGPCPLCGRPTIWEVVKTAPVQRCSGRGCRWKYRY